MSASAVTGQSAIDMYEPENGLLTKITVLILNSADSPFTTNRIIKTIVSEYDEKYGAHTTEIISTARTTKKSKTESVHFTEELIF